MNRIEQTLLNTARRIIEDGANLNPAVAYAWDEGRKPMMAVFPHPQDEASKEENFLLMALAATCLRADSATLVADTFTKVVNDESELAVMLAPSEDPTANDALAAVTLRKDGTWAVTTQSYHRNDDGTLRWDEPEEMAGAPGEEQFGLGGKAAHFISRALIYPNEPPLTEEHLYRVLVGKGVALMDTDTGKATR